VSTFGTCDKCGADLVSACPFCGKPTELYSRVVGFYRPVQSWNPGKQQEFADRKTFVIGQGDHQEIT